MNSSDIDLDSPAIKALGSLFKLTQVFLWDDGCPIDSRQISSCPKHIRFKYDDDDDDEGDNGIFNDDSGVTITLNTNVETSEENVLMKEGDLFQEMSALGLPLSFQTSKQGTSKQSSARMKGKHKTMLHKDDDSQSRSKDQVQVFQEVSKESVQDKSTNAPPLSLTDQTEHSCSGSDVSDDHVKLPTSDGRDKSANEAAVTGCDNLKCMSSESIMDDLLGADCQMGSRMMSIAATSDLVEVNASCACYTLDNCSEEHPKEINENLMEEKQSIGKELGSFAMQMEDLDSSICDEQTEVDGMPKDSLMDLDHNANDPSCSATSVAWNAYWDSFYMRFYFYNTETQESTWYPPPGMENFACGVVSDVLDESNEEVTRINVDITMSHSEMPLNRDEFIKKTCSNELAENMGWGAQEFSSEESKVDSAMNLDGPCVFDEICEDETANNNFIGNAITQLSDSSSLSSVVEEACYEDILKHVYMDEQEAVHNGSCLQDAPAATKRKKKRKNRRRKKSFYNEDNAEFQPVEEYVDITKYWCQRYLLFSKFDDGVQLDDEGWFSVTPEAIAIHHASRLGGDTVVDCFAGVGGNVIQFATTSKHVIAIDIDPKKIDYAHHNAAIYGVEDKIDFINGDCFSLAPKLKAETIFLSPPWGGPNYLKAKSYDLDMLQPFDGQFLFDTFKATASLIIMFLPRNVDIVQLAELSLSSTAPWSLEVERNFLNGKLKAVTAYFTKIKASK